jgi:hypothetical protein
MSSTSVGNPFSLSSNVRPSSIQLMRLSSRGLARLKDKQTLLGTCLCVPTCKKLFTAFGGGKGQETRCR